MKQRFMGEWFHKVDAKGRVSIPAQFRRVLEEHDPDCGPGDAPSFVIAQGLSEHPRLECYTMTSMDALNRMVETYKPFSQEREDMEALIYGGSNYVQLDENGRMVLSPRLREAIGLKDEATLVGSGERFHIWDSANYAAYRAVAAPTRRNALALLDPSRLRGDAA